MTVTRFLAVYAVTLPIFLVIDFLWLGVVAGRFYRQHLAHLLADGVNWPAAVLFYLSFAGGLVFFAVGPALEAGSAMRALPRGALFGFFAYATYDLTNLATLKSWSVPVSLIDMAWGTVLTGVTATAATLAALQAR